TITARNTTYLKVSSICSSSENVLYYNQTIHLSNLHQKPQGRGNMAAMPLLIKEDPPKPAYTKHDQLFKELINTFFKEFLEAFFPDVTITLIFTRLSHCPRKCTRTC